MDASPSTIRPKPPVGGGPGIGETVMCPSIQTSSVRYLGIASNQRIRGPRTTTTKTTLPTLEPSTSWLTLHIVVIVMRSGTVVGQQSFQIGSATPPTLSVDSKMHAITMTFATVTAAIRAKNVRTHSEITCMRSAMEATCRSWRQLVVLARLYRNLLSRQRKR